VGSGTHRCFKGRWDTGETTDLISRLDLLMKKPNRPRWLERQIRRKQPGVFLIAALLPLVGCSDVSGPAATGQPVEVTLDPVVSGLSSPVFLTAPSGDLDRLFVVERPGRIRIVRNDAVETTPYLDVSASISAGGERGLLGLAFHPDYAQNGRFFVNFTDAAGDTQIVRYTVSGNPDVADPASTETILSVAQPFPNHNGGMIAFGADGLLYIGMGDGGNGGDPLGHGQNPATLLGSMLRIDVDGALPYVVPPDNPFVGHPTTRPETWSFGLRNPWRFSFDRQTGDLYIGDVGQGGWEEVSFQAHSSSGGQNYGWKVIEGSNCYSPANGCSLTGLTLPVLEYSHSDGCSITGGYVYRGSMVPGWAGRYFYADFCSTWIRSFVMVGGATQDLQDHSADLGPVPSVSSFGEGGDGELYVVSLGGEIYRLAPQ
jgi:glucose/arabinose dehydrogenase